MAHDRRDHRRRAEIGLIQGSIDIEMKHDPTQAQRIFDEYFELSRRAVREHPEVDLLVWPETMFRYPWFTFSEDYVSDAGHDQPEEAVARSRRAVENTVLPLGVPLMLGIDTVHGTPACGIERYNSALFLDRDGDVLGRYDKVPPRDVRRVRAAGQDVSLALSADAAAHGIERG